MKCDEVLQRMLQARKFSVTASSWSDTQTDKTTHFGFETVTEAEKGQKGWLL